MKSEVKVPFLNLKNQIQQLPHIHQKVQNLIESCAFVGGPSVEVFEKNFAEFVQSDFCVGVGNGTDALEIALQALELPAGSEVIVPANTFVASAEAIINSGLIPRFVDCSSDHLNLDPNSVEQAITSKTSAVMVVHLYGQAAPMNELLDLCHNKNLIILEDCAQAHGATYNDKPVGSFGSIAAYSFYPGKNLGAFGDAGAITTNDPDLANKCRKISMHGAMQKYMHEINGRNSRLDSLQALVLNEKLKKLPEWNRIRKHSASLYLELLSDIPHLKLTKELELSEGVYHLMVARHPKRDLIRKKLEDYGIQSGIHYPHALTQLPHYSKALKPETCKEAEDAASQVFSLPMGEHMNPDSVKYVCDSLRSIIVENEF
ncbi:MAG: DegT/DnrJ/EryC1/StrS family aminotransferase [bacterium]|nr:DegT/DnrJ/EryC1/StrS family aminotransferase [bacterium]